MLRSITDSPRSSRTTTEAATSPKIGRTEFERAASLTRNARERALLGRAAVR